MAKVKIYLKYDAGQLMSSDNKKGPFEPIEKNTTTQATSGDMVEWVCTKKSGLKSIFIVKNPGSENVFSKNPKPAGGNKKCWIGTTESGIQQTETENYTIGFKPKGEELLFLDPKIKLKPGGG